VDTTVLIACRDASQGALLDEVLARKGCRCITVVARRPLIEAIGRDKPHLLLLDADLDGRAFDLLPELYSIDVDLGVLLLLEETDLPSAVEAARMGVLDFITRPFDPDKIPIRVAVAAERRRQLVGDRLYKLALEKRINVRTSQVWDKTERLRRQVVSTIEALEQTLAAKHDYTEGHSRRVGNISVALAAVAGLAAEEVQAVELAARFHDIGKIGIRDQVLNKPGPLTDAEYEHVKEHPMIAARILAPLEAFAPVLPLIKHEHERWDGRGYPGGLKGEAIPLGARIIAIADTFDALVSDRSYRRGRSTEEALKEIRRCAGTQFDPRLVDLFARLIAEGSVDLSDAPAPGADLRSPAPSAGA
jgi:response regulator RpfG family c-di-GMP phosphodiesterase